jgi:vanillate O-demethylase ferredoxin subunit
MGFSFTTSTKEVLEQVVREPRFRALTTIPLFAPMEIGLVCGAFGLFALSSHLYMSGAIHWLAMMAMNSFAVYASFTPLHDATHRTVSRNRRINDLIGTISCLLLLPGITTRIYRFLHLEHHRYSGDEIKDPDEPFVSSPPWALPFVLAGLDVLWSRWYIARWLSRPPGERREFVLCITFYVLFHLAWLASPYALEFVLLWMIPQRLGLFYVAWFFAHIQHPKDMLWEETPFQATVRVVAKPWTRWLLLGQANHHIHHLTPSVPYYRYHLAWNQGKYLFERQMIPTRTIWSPSNDLVMPRRVKSTWLEAKVESAREVASDILSLEFVPADNTNWPAFTAGSHIDVRVGDIGARQYSLCNSPADENRYLIAVKHDPEGSGGSHYIHTAVKPGDLIQLSAPRNNFPLQTDFSDYLLIAGGIGVTPLLAMAHELYSSGRSFTLNICARSAQSIAFHESLDTFPFADRIVTHVANSQVARRLDPTTDIGQYNPGRGLYLCGPTGFMAWVMREARRLSWPTEAVFSETFVPPEVDNAENTRFEVELAHSGRVLTIEPNESLLDILNANACPVICSCTQGICGSCMTPVLDGIPDHRDAVMTDAERAANDQMTVCVSRAKSARIVLDL